MQQYEDQPDDKPADDQNDQRDGEQDVNRDHGRAVPTVPHQRRPAPEENWTPDGAHRIPLQPGRDDTGH
jgi:hypothetical protein